MRDLKKYPSRVVAYPSFKHASIINKSKQINHTNVMKKAILIVSIYLHECYGHKPTGTQSVAIVVNYMLILASLMTEGSHYPFFNIFCQLYAHTCLTVGRIISFDLLLNLCQLDAHTGLIVRRRISSSLLHTLCCQLDAHTGLTVGRRISPHTNNHVFCVCWDKFTGAAKCRSS